MGCVRCRRGGRDGDRLDRRAIRMRNEQRPLACAPKGLDYSGSPVAGFPGVTLEFAPPAEIEKSGSRQPDKALRTTAAVWVRFKVRLPYRRNFFTTNYYKNPFGAALPQRPSTRNLHLRAYAAALAETAFRSQPHNNHRTTCSKCIHPRRTVAYRSLETRQAMISRRKPRADRRFGRNHKNLRPMVWRALKVTIDRWSR